MSSQKVITREEKIIALIERDIEIMDDSTIYDVFENGCVGYSNMSNDEINEYYDNYILISGD